MRRFAFLPMICGLFAWPASAQFYTETFEAYNVGNLAEQGGWTAHSVSGVIPVQVVLDNGPTFPGTRAAQLVEGSTSREDVSDPFGMVMGVGDRWYFGVDVKISGGNDADYFMHFRTGTLFVPRLAIRADGDGFNFGLKSPIVSYPDVYETVTRSLDVWYRIVASYEYETGNTALWVNPSLGDVDNPDIQSRIYVNYEVGEIALRQASGTATITLDNILVSDVFGDVVPEPAAVALLGLAGLALVRRRQV
jgi:hypothetical protein